MDRYCEDGLPHDIDEDINGIEFCTVCGGNVDNPDVEDINDD